MNTLASKMIGKHKTSMKASRTMPMLRSYTREDIQEQYLSSKQARVAQQEQYNQPNDPPSLANDPDSENSSERKRQILATGGGVGGGIGSGSGIGNTIEWMKPNDKIVGNSNSKRARSIDARTSERGRSGQRDYNNNDRIEGAAAGRDALDRESDFESDNHGNEDEASDENSVDQASGCSRRARRRKRRRRAHSASLFSACFNIPNFGNILTASSGQSQTSSQQQQTHRGGSQETGHSQKRSILAHLRLQQPSTSGKEQSEMSRRPISASQTAGNLKQAAMAGALNDSDQTPTNTAGSLRKHVSFQGSHTHSALYKTSASDSRDQQIDHSKPSTTAGDESRRVPSSDRGESGSTIIRNYQPSVALTARLGSASKTVVPATTNVQSPLYRPSPTSTQLNQPIQQQPRGSQQQPYVSGTVNTFLSRTSTAQQQDHTLHGAHQRAPNSANPIQSQSRQSSTRAALPSNPNVTPVQVYRRLPAVPTRTQATQTEITAYHLMTTPPISSGTSSIAGVGGGSGTGGSCRDASVADGSGRSSTATTTQVGLATGTAGLGDTPSSPTTTGGPSSNQTPIRSEIGSSRHRIKTRLNERKNTLDDEENEWSLTRDSASSPVKPLRKLTQKQQHQQPCGPSSSSSRFEERNTENPSDNEDDDDIDAVANLNASLMLASSSCSSSSASLVGHDSALANSLHCEHVRVSSSTMGEMPEAVSVKPSRKLEQSRKDDKYMIESRARQHEPPASSKQSVVTDRESQCNTKIASSSLDTRPVDIEPPGEFMDYENASMNYNPEQTDLMGFSSQQRQQQQQNQQKLQTNTQANNTHPPYGGVESIDRGVANVADSANYALNEDEPLSLSEASSQTDASFAPTRTSAEVGRLLSGKGGGTGLQCWSGTPASKATPIASQVTPTPVGEGHSSSNLPSNSSVNLERRRRSSQPPDDTRLQQHKQRNYKQRSTSHLHSTSEIRSSTTGAPEAHKKPVKATRSKLDDGSIGPRSEDHRSQQSAYESSSNQSRMNSVHDEPRSQVIDSSQSVIEDKLAPVTSDVDKASEQAIVRQRESDTESNAETTGEVGLIKGSTDSAQSQKNRRQLTGDFSSSTSTQQSMTDNKLAENGQEGSFSSHVVEDRTVCPSRPDNTGSPTHRSIDAEQRRADLPEQAIRQVESTSGIGSSMILKTQEQQQPQQQLAVALTKHTKGNKEKESVISASQPTTSDSAVRRNSEIKSDISSTGPSSTASISERATTLQTEPIETPTEVSIVYNVDSQLAQSFVQKPSNVIRSSTSTLSTRHHSYCSTSEASPFGALVRTVDENDGEDDDLSLAVDGSNMNVNAATPSAAGSASAFMSDTLDIVDEGYGCAAGEPLMNLSRQANDARGNGDEYSESGNRSKVEIDYSSMDDESLNASSNSVATRISYAPSANKSADRGSNEGPGVHQTARTLDDEKSTLSYVQAGKNNLTDTINATPTDALAATATTTVVTAIAAAATSVVPTTTPTSTSPGHVLDISSNGDVTRKKVSLDPVEPGSIGSKTDKRLGSSDSDADRPVQLSGSHDGESSVVAIAETAVKCDKLGAPALRPTTSAGKLGTTVSGGVSGNNFGIAGEAPSSIEDENTTKTIKRNRARATFMDDTEAAAAALEPMPSVQEPSVDNSATTVNQSSSSSIARERSSNRNEDDSHNERDHSTGSSSGSKGHKISDRRRSLAAKSESVAEVGQATEPEQSVEDIAPKESSSQKAKAVTASSRSFSSSSSAASSNMMRSVDRDDRKSSISSAGSAAQSAKAQQQRPTTTAASSASSVQRKPTASSSFCMSTPSTSSSSSSLSTSSSFFCKERALESSASSTSAASRIRRIDELTGHKRDDELGTDYRGFSGVGRGVVSEIGGRANTDGNSLNEAPATGANKDTAREPPSSPPTTVSELDADEDLSTPSFVDSYRERFEQARNLADTVLEGALNQWLETEQRKQSEDAQDKRPRLSSLAKTINTGRSSSSDAGDSSMHKKPLLPLSESSGVVPKLGGTSNDALGQQTKLNDCCIAEQASQEKLIGYGGAYKDDVDEQGQSVEEAQVKIKQEVKFAGNASNQSGAARNQEPCLSSDHISNSNSSSSSGGGSSCSSATTVSSRPKSGAHVPPVGARPTMVKPKPPAKPAHLQREQVTSYMEHANQLAEATAKQNSEAAAAVAVTATSLAGAAAALHSSNSSVSGSGGQPRGLESFSSSSRRSEGTGPLDDKRFEDAVEVGSHIDEDDAISVPVAQVCSTEDDDRDERQIRADVSGGDGVVVVGADREQRSAPADSSSTSSSSSSSHSAARSAGLGSGRDDRVEGIEGYDERDAVDNEPPNYRSRVVVEAPEVGRSADEDNAAHNAILPEVARQSSLELSTVSEASEERSGAHQSHSQSHSQSQSHLTERNRAQTCTDADQSEFTTFADDNCNTQSSSLAESKGAATASAAASWAKPTQTHLRRTDSAETGGAALWPQARRQSPSSIGGVDCPYVHDIQPLSPPPPSSFVQPSCSSSTSPQPPQTSATQPATSGPTMAQVQAQAGATQAEQTSHALRRLSHDDTMEAIEDDVEGEEQELAAMAAMAADGSASASAQVVCGHTFALRTDSIREEDEEEGADNNGGGDDDDDEESSISVSQRGVIVQPCGPSSRLQQQRQQSQEVDANKAVTTTATTTTTTTHSSPGSCSSAPLGEDGDDVEDEGARTPTAMDERDPLGSGGVVCVQTPPPKAILEHLSRHHPVPISLDEPSLGPEQARSLSMDVHSRRELWRLDSTRTRDKTQDSGEGVIDDIDVDVDVRPDDSNALHSEQDRESLKENKTPTPTSDLADADEQVDVEQTHLMHRSLAGSLTSTGTIKRARRALLGEKSKSQEASDAGAALDATGQAQQHPQKQLTQRDDSTEQQQPQQQQQQQPTTTRRGPPLSQLRGTQASRSTSSQHTDSIGAAVGSGPMASGASQAIADTSICSSCSCMETTTDSASAQVAPAQAASTSVEPQSSQAQRSSSSQQQKQLGTGASASGPGAVGKQQPQQWMSQEEGTVFTENYWLPHWLYISEHEESEIWRRAIDMGNTSSAGDPSKATGDGDSVEEVPPGMPIEMCELESTASERSFSTRYKSTTRKMIHRRATIEMYKRIMNNNLKCEKRVEISRSNGEFGFRIHGSRPVVVSAIERGTSAEICGLQVGDLIYAINGTNILDMAHSDVVRLAHNVNSPALVLDLVPTNEFLRMSKYNRAANNRYEPSVTGYLMRLSPSTAQPMLFELQERLSRSPGVSSQQRANELNQVMRLVWRRRYFVLRSDNCLYWYKSPTDVEPYGGINLQGFSATLTNEFREPNYVIRLVKYGGQPHYLGTNNLCDIQTWIDAINKAATEANQNDPYMKRTLMLVRGKPHQIPEPDHNGYLHKYSQKRTGGAHWRPAYFVLKDACLYMFRDRIENVTQASAVYYLHGYKVRSKTIENKKHTFELVPPNRETIKPMFLMAASEIEKKSWIAALEYSIDRWIEID